MTFSRFLRVPRRTFGPFQAWPLETICTLFPPFFPHMLAECKGEWGPRKSVWNRALTSRYELSWTLKWWRNILYYVYLMRRWGWFVTAFSLPWPIQAMVEISSLYRLFLRIVFPCARYWGLTDGNTQSLPNKEANITSKRKSIISSQFPLLKALKSLLSSLCYLFQRILYSWFLPS